MSIFYPDLPLLLDKYCYAGNIDNDDRQQAKKLPGHFPGGDLIRACILLNIDPHYLQTIMSALRAVEGVAEANAIHGPYDCLVELHQKDFETLNQSVQEIRLLEGVRESLTCLDAQSWREEARLPSIFLTSDR